MVLIAVWGAVAAVSAKPAMSSGIHEDFSRFFSFLLARQETAIDGRFTRTDAADHQALVLTFSARLPYRAFLLTQPELSYVSMTAGGKTFNTAGDLRVRMRVRAWSGRRLKLYVLPGVRAGTGSTEVFPYSTATIDVEAGLALVHALPGFSWWLSGVGAYPSRVDDALKDPNIYDSYATVSGGAALPLSDRFTLMSGVVVLVPRHDAAREIYFLQGKFDHSPSTAFYGFGQAESGDRANRAVDFAVGGGVRLTF